MWDAVNIKFKNLFAHVESEYEFRQNTCTVIYGDNLTDAGFENNGSGKSTLFEAIDIAIRGKSSRNIDKEVFINYDANDCEIDFTLYNAYLKKELRIVRRFFRGGKSAQVEVWENGEKNTQLTSVNAANKYILDLLGITDEDLGRYYIIGQDSRYTFFTAGDADKKEILNRITNADMLDGVIESLAERRKEILSATVKAEKELSAIDGKIELVEEQIENLEEDKAINEQITELQEQIADANKQISDKNKLCKTARSDEEKFRDELKKLQSQYKDPKKIKKEIRAKNEEISEYRKVISDIDIALSGEIECPNCKHKFLHSDEYDITPEEAAQLRQSAVDAAMALISEKEKLDDELGKIEELSDKIDDAEFVVDQVAKKVRRFTREISDLTADKARWEKRIVSLREEQNKDAQRKSLTHDKQVLEKERKSSEQTLKTLNADLDMVKFWEYHMGRSGFSTYLANKSVKIIEGMTNSFLKKFGVDLSVLINGFKINKDGTVRDKIEVFIQMNGLDAQPFMGKSGGERGRVQLAGIMALQHLINLSTHGKGLNLLLLDEVFPGIDPLGQENIIKILEQAGITVMMITQTVSSNFNNENTLRVIKKDGVSRYV